MTIHAEPYSVRTVKSLISFFHWQADR